MKAQSTGGTAKNGYKKLRDEKAVKKAAANGTIRGNAGRKPAPKVRKIGYSAAAKKSR
jgi:hypothetical protein